MLNLTKIPEYNQKVEDRLLIQERSKHDLEFRKEVLYKCYEDSTYWCDNFAYTFDPRQETRALPFILWDRQIELVRWAEYLIDENKDGLVEKSMDMGVSYTILTPVILYQWLFHDFNAKLGSRKEELVDKTDDPDSLFWKLDFTLKRIPNWMLPDRFEWDKHRTYMRLSRPDNENVITGESANPDFARAGRNNLTLFDELGFWPWATASWESAGESTTTRLGVSTPPKTGRASFFYKHRRSGKADVFTFHYLDDPRKDKTWVTKQRSKKTDEEFERELNISYSGSTEGTVYATHFKLCAFGEFDYVADLPLFVSWDFGLDGVAMQWYQWKNSVDKWYLIDSYFNSQKDIGFYIPFVNGDVKSEKGYEYSNTELEIIKRHKEWKSATHFGDPDVKKRSLHTSLSTRDVLKRDAGIYVQSKNWESRTHYDMRQLTLLFFNKLSIDEKKNEFFTDCIMQARYPERTETSQSTTPIQKPIHNWTSHHRTSLEYMADNAPKPRKKIERKKQESMINRLDPRRSR